MTEPRRFPALDAEPPPRPLLRRRAAVVSAALGVSAVIAAALVLRPAGDAQAPAAITTQGAVIVWRTNQSLVVTNPDGSNPRAATAIGSTDYPLASLDGRYAVDINGVLWALQPGGVRRVGRVWGPAGSAPLGVPPLAAHDRYLVVGGKDFHGDELEAELRPLDHRTGKAQRVGLRAPDAVAGDPTAAAVFATEPVGGPVAVAGQFHQADSRVLYARAGASPHTVLTSRRAAAILGLKPPLALSLWPAPDGHRVAVAALEVAGAAAGVVVADARGRVIDAFPLGASPAAGLAWSGSGALAVTPNPPRSVLVWTDGQLHHVVVRLPLGEQFGGSCQWSPDGGILLCPTFADNDVSHWLLVRVDTGAQQVVPAPGIPVAWLAEDQQ